MSLENKQFVPLIYFSDYFNVDRETVAKYGAFDISLVNDLPLFIDPFLLFESDSDKYIKLHESIIGYVKFLKEILIAGAVSKSEIEHLFHFPEVKQNWLGFSKVGNGGSGLGKEFAEVLIRNLKTIFSNFGEEKVSNGSHLEKLGLMSDHVGRDHLSDFTTNLIKKFLLEYTQEFALEYMDKSKLSLFAIDKVEFDFKTQKWLRGKYMLPVYENDYVILTPRDLLTKDEAWINRSDLIGNFKDIYSAIPDELLRSKIDDYFLRRLSENASTKEIADVSAKAIEKFPEVLDYYIKKKEIAGSDAIVDSLEKVVGTEKRFVKNIRDFSIAYLADSGFYENDDSYDESMRRLLYLKDVIENQDGYRFLYVDGKAFEREMDLQIMFRLCWAVSTFEVDSEVNNGRGPVDFKISKGRGNKTLVEFKIGSNTQLKRNLKNQVAIYEKANSTKKSIKAILCFTEGQQIRLQEILKELNLLGDKDIVMIDARNDNKPSASKA